jgi:hypothetical protein
MWCRMIAGTLGNRPVFVWGNFRRTYPHFTHKTTRDYQQVPKRQEWLIRRNKNETCQDEEILTNMLYGLNLFSSACPPTEDSCREMCRFDQPCLYVVTALRCRGDRSVRL